MPTRIYTMTKKQNDFIELAILAFQKEALKKLIFSRPRESKASKAVCRLCAHRGKRILAIEYSMPDNTVSQKNVIEENLFDALSELIISFNQANLLTTLKDAEWKISKSGKEALLGFDALKNKLNGEKLQFESAIEELDKRKNYILSGNEDFLYILGISDKSGRVHDKKQGKFRQINRFLEHISDIYHILPQSGTLTVYDLCCGKSYLSFALYHYLTAHKKREVYMLGVDLKSDVISWCDGVAKSLGYTGMHFICDDVNNTPANRTPDMVISLHACDIATDIVINAAMAQGAKVILSTPCCHRYLNDKISAEALSFVSAYGHLNGKLCEAITDAIRLARMSAGGYKASALELTDPENTPKNTLLRAIKDDGVTEAELNIRKEKYESILRFVLGENKDSYLKEITKNS